MTKNNKESGNSRSFKAALDAGIQEYATGKLTQSYRTLHIKAMIFLLVAGLLYSLLVFKINSFPEAVAYAFLLGLSLLGIGFNIMHDAVHGSFAKQLWLNNLARLSAELVGANSCFWEMNHNQKHHIFTNMSGKDPDIDFRGFARLDPATPWQKRFKYQQFYVWFFYLFVHLRFSVMDLQQLVFLMLGKENSYSMYFRNKNKRHLFYQMIFGKFMFIGLFVAVPLLFHPWYAVTSFYLGTSMLIGLGLSVVFQLAHAVDNVDHIMPENQNVSSDWSLGQIATTSDFATNNSMITFACGGLNFQIEHHLRPKLPHVLYPGLSKVIEKVCREYGVNLNSHNTMPEALGSHYRFLKAMGIKPLKLAN